MKNRKTNPETDLFQKKRTDSTAFAMTCKIISVLLFLGIWQVLVDLNVLSPLMFGNLPSPLRVVKALAVTVRQKEYYVHIIYSIRRVFVGCGIALILGVAFGMAIALNKYCNYFFMPIFDLLRPVPQITWIPISILLFPTVEGSIQFITFMGAFFPILINTIAGVNEISPNLVTAAVSMHANRRQLILHVYFKGALPGIFVGLSVGLGTSWMSVIAAEMISGQHGIGYYTWLSYNLMNYENTMIGMITIGIIGLISFAGLNRVKQFVLRYQKTDG